MRYELKDQFHPHPWRKVINPISRQLEPAHYSRRGVWDSEANEWATTPADRAQSQYADVRRLNGLPLLTPQKVRAVLKKAGLVLDSTHTTRIRGWHGHTGGYSVEQDARGRLFTGYVFDHWRRDKPYDAVLAKALAALQGAGLTCELQLESRRIEL